MSVAQIVAGWLYLTVMLLAALFSFPGTRDVDPAGLLHTMRLSMGAAVLAGLFTVISLAFLQFLPALLWLVALYIAGRVLLTAHRRWMKAGDHV